jgi:hypothetical protein
MKVFFLTFIFLWCLRIGIGSYLIPRVIPYLGFFPYQEFLKNFNLPEIFTKLANFDGVHYLLIARQGYSQYEQAFFPLYPLLIRLGSLLIKNELIVGLLISNISFVVGWYFFYQYLRLILPKANFFWLVFLILFFPTSFYFNIVYSEGLFFLLLFFSLYKLEKKQYWQAAIGFFFLSLTRLIGVFVFIPVLFHLLSQLTREKKRFNYLINFKNITLISSPFLGLFSYMFYLRQTTGDWLFFFHAQPFFGASRSTILIFLPQVYWRYLKIFFTASFNFQYFIALFEFFIFNFVVVILVFDLIKNLQVKEKNFSYLGLHFFSWINLVLPTFTGTFSSIPRYVLLSFAFFIFLSQIKRLLIIFLSVIFFILHWWFFGLFIQGYFIG